MDRDEIKDLLEELNNKLAKENKKASILIAGGAAISFLFEDDRKTKDIDGVILSTNVKNDVLLDVKKISTEKGINEDWFNEAIKGFVNLSWEKEELKLGFSNLEVYSVKPEQLLAMKLASARVDSKDVEDSIKLMKHLNIKSVEEALNILEDNIPSKSSLTAKMEYFTKVTFEDYKREINEMEKINNQTQNQNKVSKDAENTKTEKLYITVHKTYCRQLEDKIHEGKTFNMISIPKGTMLNGKDIGERVINPKLMYENPYNQNEMVAQYDIGHLTDNSIMLKNLNEATSEKVDIKELKAAIDTQKENYKAMKQQQNEKQHSIHKNKEKDKGEEL